MSAWMNMYWKSEIDSSGGDLWRTLSGILGKGKTQESEELSAVADPEGGPGGHAPPNL